MTFLRPTGSQWRTPEIGKSVIVSSWRGVTRVQAWPKPRGIPKTVHERTRLDIFRLFNRLIKALSPWETLYVREAIKEHNRKNRGQRGSAAIRMRDWQLQRLYGRGVAVVVDQNLTFYPAAVRRTASAILDHCTHRTGDLLQRQLDAWTEGPASQPGDVLTSGGPGQPNYWQTPPK